MKQSWWNGRRYTTRPAVDFLPFLYLLEQLLEQEELKREDVLSERDQALAEVTREGNF